MGNYKAKNKKARKIVLISMVSVILLCLIIFLIWYLIPKKMPRADADDIARIYVFDGNSGLEANFTKREDIEYIIGELHSTEYETDRPAFILGTTFRLYFYDENGKLLDHLILMNSVLVYRNCWFYRPEDSLEELEQYFYDYLGCQW